MSQVNVNTAPPPPPRPPSRWPIYAFIAILAVLLLGGLAVYAGRRATHQATAQPTSTATVVTRASTGGPTATVAAGGVGGATSTATSSGGGAAPTSGATATGATPNSGATATGTTKQQPPTNPTLLRVSSGSCTAHRIAWTWSGAQRATSYDVGLYNPTSGAQIKNAVTSTTAYTLPAGPGATVGLKVRGRNAAGTAPNYFTPGGTTIGRVPPVTANPHDMKVTTTGRSITWSWTAVPHATAYDLVLYHYSGSVARTDITARTSQAHWSTAVTPGVTYHLKARSVGDCAPSTYYTPPTSAVAGATPTPGAH